MSMKRLALLLPVALAAAIGLAGERHFTRNDSQFINAESVPLVAGDTARTRVGALRYLGGWVLRSHNVEFGGFSGLSRLADGRFLAISDSGQMAAFRLVTDGTRAKIEDSFIAPLPGATGLDENGEKLSYRDRDSESVTSNPSRSRFWIGYENRGAIRRFGADFARVSATARPSEMSQWPNNGGAEALVRLSDGRFLLFAEAEEVPGGGTDALLFSGDPTAPGVAIDHFIYNAPEGYRITDAAQLPDGRLLLLHRRLVFPDGFTALLAIADPADVTPGGRLDAREMARLDPPVTVDNMEGLFVERENGRTIVWLISDDNHMVLQRTLLLKFALEDSAGRPVSPAVGPRPGFQSR